MKKIFFLILISSLATTGLFAQKKVVPLPVDSAFAFGKEYVVYALPKTAFQVEVTLTLSHEFEGIYSQYAAELLNLPHVITQDKESYSLKNVDIQSIVLPDTTRMYAVELSSAQLKKGLRNQLLLSREKSGKNQESLYYAPQTIQIPEFFRNYSDLAYEEQTIHYMDTLVENDELRAVEKQQKKMVTKTDAQHAKEAADMISQIREDRYALLTGDNEVAYQPTTLQMMLDNLNEMEQNYLSLFTGFVVEEELHYTVVVIPDSTTMLIPLFSVSPTLGFNPRLSAKPDENFYLRMEPAENVATSDIFAVQWSCAKGHKPNTGYRIRVPQPTQLSLIQGNSKVKAVGERNVYQFGTIETLPLNYNAIDIEEIGIIF